MGQKTDPDEYRSSLLEIGKAIQEYSTERVQERDTRYAGGKTLWERPPGLNRNRVSH